jgi:hypothetical protein
MLSLVCVARRQPCVAEDEHLGSAKINRQADFTTHTWTTITPDCKHQPARTTRIRCVAIAAVSLKLCDSAGRFLYNPQCSALHCNRGVAPIWTPQACSCLARSQQNGHWRLSQDLPARSGSADIFFFGGRVHMNWTHSSMLQDNLRFYMCPREANPCSKPRRLTLPLS